MADLVGALLDKDIEKRGMVLPLGRTTEGHLKFAMPQIGVDLARALTMPGRAMQGEQLGEADARQFAMDVVPTSGFLSGATRAVPKGAFGMNVFHGGPHKWAPEPDFPHGRPRLDKLGTGEGAQAYGHGFYAAEAPDVAQTYINPEGSYKRLSGHLSPKAEFAYDFLEKGNGTTEVMEKMLARYGADLDFDDAIRAIDEAKAVKAGTGTLYKLDLPDEDVAKYLDWDAPLSEQPETVQSIFNAAFKNPPDGVDRFEWMTDLMKAEKFGPNDPVANFGTEFYRVLEKHLGQEEASKYLRERGIPGLKYYDGSSRAAGEGTRNYVTWDQDVLNRTKILERNGEVLGKVMKTMEDIKQFHSRGGA